MQSRGLTPFTVSLLVLCHLFSACRTRTPDYIEQNRKSGQQIVIAANAYTLDALAKFPASLTNLIGKGLLTSVPKCQCQDGGLRDFVYIPGFTIADSGQYVILVTPEEMDLTRAIIFRINGDAELVPREKARLEVDKSITHIKNREQGEPD